MSGTKVGGDFLGFDLFDFAVELIAAGGVAALTTARKIKELYIETKEAKKALEERQQAQRAEAELCRKLLERKIETNSLNKNAKDNTDKTRDVKCQNNAPDKHSENRPHIIKSIDLLNQVDYKSIKRNFNEIVLISSELLPHEWQERKIVERQLEKAKEIINAGISYELQHKQLKPILDSLRSNKKRYLNQINRIESLRRQYIEEVATARALLSIKGEKAVLDEFDHEKAESQIENLQEFNSNQRKYLESVYNNPALRMTEKKRKEAVKQVSDRIEKVMNSLGNELAGSTVRSNIVSRYYHYGNALLRCSVADNGTIVMEVVGDACGEKNVNDVLIEMKRFNEEFNKIQASLEKNGVGFKKYAESLPCQEAVVFYDINKDSRSHSKVKRLPNRAEVHNEKM